MKKSEKLHQEAQQEENDLAYLGKIRKMKRQQNVEVFGDWYDKLIESPNVISITEHTIQGKFEIKTDTVYGTVDYYPKANKVLIRHKNKWQQQGLNWMKKYLIKE